MPRLFNKRDFISYLIDDEIEAIEGYDDAIAETDDPHAIEVLTHIRDEEYEHIEELKALKGE